MLFLQRLDKHQRSELGEECKQFADLSVWRAWRAVSRSRGSAWTAIFAYITGNRMCIHRISDPSTVLICMCHDLTCMCHVYDVHVTCMCFLIALYDNCACDHGAYMWVGMVHAPSTASYNSKWLL